MSRGDTMLGPRLRPQDRNAYKAKLDAANTTDRIAADLAAKEIEAEIEARKEAPPPWRVTWAKELARYNIRVAGIAPGFSDTRMVATIPPKVKDQIISTIPLRGSRDPRRSVAARFSSCGMTTTTAGFWSLMTLRL